MTHEQLARIFEEWLQRYILDPEDFMSHLDMISEVPMEYGEKAAHYFEFLAKEVGDGANTGS